MLKKHIKEQDLREIIFSLLDYGRFDHDIIKKSLRSRYQNVEDVIQIYAAHTIKNLDYIVTEKH